MFNDIEKKDVFTYHYVAASLLAKVFEASVSSTSMTDKETKKNLIKMGIIYAITLKPREDENVKDYEALCAGKYFGFKVNLDKTEDAFRVMIEKWVIADLTPVSQMDFTPKYSYKGIDAAKSDSRA